MLLIYNLTIRYCKPLKEEIFLSREKLVEVCPVCGSSDVYYEVGGYAGTVYHCKECGYVGAFVIEANEEMIEIIKERHKRESEKEGDLEKEDDLY